jgi:holin-like protein
MIRALAVLLVCQLAGEVLTHALGLPVPGPVIGLALLAVGAVIHARIAGTEARDLGVTASALLGSLGLLFVPAGVGIVQQLPLIGSYALAIFAALLVSTVLTLLVTVYVLSLSGARSRRVSQGTALHDWSVFDLGLSVGDASALARAYFGRLDRRRRDREMVRPPSACQPGIDLHRVDGKHSGRDRNAL